MIENSMIVKERRFIPGAVYYFGCAVEALYRFRWVIRPKTKTALTLHRPITAMAPTHRHGDGKATVLIRAVFAAPALPNF